MIQEGQLIFQHYKVNDTVYYDLGVVTDVYDNRYFAKMKHKNHTCSFEINDIKETLTENEEGVMLLMKNRKPAFAKRNLFGKYKFS